MPQLTHIYRPKHQQQKVHFQGKLIGCTEDAFAMYADAVTLGGVILSEKIVRAMSNEPEPNPASPGLNHGQIDTIAAHLHIEFHNRDLQGDTWDDVMAHLDADRRIMLSIVLPSGVGHQLLLQARRSRPGGVSGQEILTNDPLLTSARWRTEAGVRAAALAWAHLQGDHGYWYAYSRKVQRLPGHA